MSRIDEPTVAQTSWASNRARHLFLIILITFMMLSSMAILRGVFLKGAGLDVLWPEGLALFGLATVILTFARLRYRVRLG